MMLVLNRNILLLFISHGIVSILSFQLGLLLFMNNNKCNDNNTNNVNNNNNNGKTSSSSSSFIQQQQQQQQDIISSSSIGYMNRNDFFHKFDMGIPLPLSSSSSSLDLEHRVMILYPEVLSSLSQSKSNTTTTTSATTIPSGLENKKRRQEQQQEITTFNRINQNCNVVKLILTQQQQQQSNNNQSSLSNTCYVIAEQHDSYYIHKFIQKQKQLNKNKRKKTTTNNNQEQQQQQRHDIAIDIDIDTKLSSTQWWEKVSQFHKPENNYLIDDHNNDNNKNKMLKTIQQSSSSMEFPPKPMITKLAFQYLQQYIQIQDEVLQQLQSLLVSSNLSTSTSSSTSSTYPYPYIIIMLCNWEQHELLLNFICQCNRLHISLNNYIIFAIDYKIYDLAKQFNINVYYHEQLFPSYNHNNHNNIEYGTIEYSYIMMAKVYIMHLMVSCLGYNVLFHDIDIIPLKSNYIDNFLMQAISSTSNNHDNNNNNNNNIYDMYFQYEMNDDITINSNNNNNIQSYIPYLANTGFYYVHNTIRTKYFFSVLIRSLDLIYRTKSHQVVMNIILNQHNTLFNLRIKTMSHINNDYPVGYHFHKNHTYMKEFLNGIIQPYMFHMNWNTNQQTKRQFFEQIGHWYVVTDDDTTNKSLCNNNNDNSMKYNETNDYNHNCCVIGEPKVICHFRDKPSKIPCHDSPMIEDQIPFW